MVSYWFGVVQDVIVLILIRMTKWPVILAILDSVGEEGIYTLFSLQYVSFARQV